MIRDCHILNTHAALRRAECSLRQSLRLDRAVYTEGETNKNGSSLILTVLSRVDNGSQAVRSLSCTVERLYFHVKLCGGGNRGVFVDVATGEWVSYCYFVPLKAVLGFERDNVAKVLSIVVLRLNRLSTEQKSHTHTHTLQLSSA